jgi:hypothetical protein
MLAAHRHFPGDCGGGRMAALFTPGGCAGFCSASITLLAAPVSNAGKLCAANPIGQGLVRAQVCGRVVANLGPRHQSIRESGDPSNRHQVN